MKTDENQPPLYPWTLTKDAESDSWIIEFPDLPGCMSHGATKLEALQNGKEAIHGWIELAREMGREIPPPGSHGRAEQVEQLWRRVIEQQPA